MSLENLFDSWREFKAGKESKCDVQDFSLRAEELIFNLHAALKTYGYRHGQYASFYIHDPKLRHIHKASVLDRVLHHAVVRVIEPLFETHFIQDSYSSRKDKGTHKAVKRLRQFAWRLSANNTKTVWALKGDIRRFFDSVDHELLLMLIGKRVSDAKAMELIREIIGSYGGSIKKGIPLGNVTSQLFSNIYLNEMDQFLKRELKAEHYIRYADDFVILSHDPAFLRSLIKRIEHFLNEKLELRLHPEKVTLKKWHQGIDFLGYVSFPHYSVLRATTKRRVLRKIKARVVSHQKGLIDERTLDQTVQSYLGLLKHCRGHGIAKKIEVLLSG